MQVSSYYAYPGCKYEAERLSQQLDDPFTIVGGYDIDPGVLHLLMEESIQIESQIFVILLMTDYS
jgi:hypothetical protein